MKKHSLYLLAAGFALLSGVALTSCDDNDVVDANDVLAVKSVLPSKVIEGQVVTISGTGLDKATAVVFPGNITVTDLTKVGSNYITVVTPAGIDAAGGSVTVKSQDEAVESITNLTIGKPEAARVAPLDKEIQINECLEVYGSDLEFITRAYFPGEDGTDVVVEAANFKRKSTGALYIYVPMGIAAGSAVVTLEDCGGKKYTLPEVTLSDKVSGGGEEVSGEGYVTVWEGEIYLYDWAVWEYMATDWFNLDGISLREGQMMRLTFDNPDGASVCVCDAWWGQPNVDGEGNNSIWVNGGTTQIEFPISEGMVTTFGTGEGMIVGGGNFTLKKIEIYRENPIVTIWEGDIYLYDWAVWEYMATDWFNLDGVTLYVDQIMRLTFDNPDGASVCICDAWWGQPNVDGAGNNSIWVEAGTSELEFPISEGMVTTFGTGEGMIVGGGNFTLKKIEVYR